MGFPSPAKDYLENRIDWNELMVPRPAADLFVPADNGFVLTNKSIRPNVEDAIFLRCPGSSSWKDSGATVSCYQNGETFEDGGRLPGILT